MTAISRIFMGVYWTNTYDSSDECHRSCLAIKVGSSWKNTQSSIIMLRFDGILYRIIPDLFSVGTILSTNINWLVFANLVESTRSNITTLSESH